MESLDDSLGLLGSCEGDEAVPTVRATLVLRHMRVGDRFTVENVPQHRGTRPSHLWEKRREGGRRAVVRVSGKRGRGREWRRQ